MAIAVGIIGYGAMGTWHADAATRVPGVRLRSVFDITPACRDEAAARFGCDVYQDLKAFLADDGLDAVVVATPSHAHVAPTLAAFRAGKHVLCEKPLVQTEREGKRLFTAAEKAGRHLMTFQNRRQDGHYLTTRKAVESGKLGRLHDIRLIEWVFTDLMRTFGAKAFRPGWRSEAAYGGGVLLDFGPHYVDQLLQLVPAPVVSVSAVLGRRRWTADADDQFILTIRFADDTLALLEVNHAAQAPIGIQWAISGSDGGYEFSDSVGKVYTRNTKKQVKQRTLPRGKDNWELLYRNFRDAIAGKADLMIQPAETLRLMRVLDAARRSHERGQVVKIDDIYAPQPTKRRRPAPSRKRKS